MVLACGQRPVPPATLQTRTCWAVNTGDVSQHMNSVDLRRPHDELCTVSTCGKLLRVCVLRHKTPSQSRFGAVALTQCGYQVKLSVV